MDKKSLIYNKLLEMQDENGVDAKTLASLLGMSRANVSHELNNFFKQGKITKTSGRPVLFSLIDQNKVRECKLDKFVKHNISLKHAIEQAKAAILYPTKGIPSLLLGETGVGKSMFASLMYDYAVEMGIKEPKSPFMIFNCADYSNNPQLLVSQLFGVKKGTYTGAESDKMGLVEKANGGVLFLDEVHRLPPEGQEALFTFLDTGYFRRMGDYEDRKSDVMIVSATTEDPHSALLKTFIRRIPMMIQIPSLKDRSLEERLYLLKSFFTQESRKLNREIYVSCNTIRAFLSYYCPNNIGQLKSDVQLLCAKAYSEFLTNAKRDVRISSVSLPTYIKEGLLKEKEHRILWNKLVGEEMEFFRFFPSIQYHQPVTENQDNGIYNMIEQKLEQLKSKGIPDIDIEHILEKDISKHFQKHIKGITEEIDKKNLLNLLGEDVLKCVDHVINYMSSALKRNFSHNIYTALALHINTLIKRADHYRSIINPHLNKIKELYPLEFEAALHAKTIIEGYIHHPVSPDEAGYLTIFLVPEEQQSIGNSSKVSIILIAHGEGTATSMAEVANRLLGENYTLAINAPLEISPSIVLEELKKLVGQEANPSGYLLLVDMGSFTVFADIIEKEFDVPVKVIPLVSTLHVIEATRKALLGFSLDEIYKSVLLVNSYMDMSRSFKELNTDNKKVAIITACLTGEGGSVAVKSVLENNLQYDKDLFEIIALNCLDKNSFKQRLLKLQQEKEILFIVSSFALDTDIKQYNMYDVINMNVIGELQENIDVKSTLIKMPLILKENIQNLDGAVLLDDISKFLRQIETKLSIHLKDATLVGLILHLAFMISRLKNGGLTTSYPDKLELISQNKDTYAAINESLAVLGDKYSIHLSDNEVCYIINYLLH